MSDKKRANRTRSSAERNAKSSPPTECDNCGHDVPVDETNACEKCGATLCNQCVCEKCVGAEG